MVMITMVQAVMVVMVVLWVDFLRPQRVAAAALGAHKMMPSHA